MSVAPLLFLSATTYYENRFEFYDLVVKRGAMLLATLVALGAFFALALPWLDGLPRDGARPWLFALAAVPLMLAAPRLAGDLSRRLDRAWFGRHYTPVSAVNHVLAAMQAATDEPSLLAAAEESLKDVLGVTVRLEHGCAADPDDARVAFKIEGSVADPSLWVTVPRVPRRTRAAQRRPHPAALARHGLGFWWRTCACSSGARSRTCWRRSCGCRSSQSELKALRAQINPHFLFNALNAIASLIHTDPARADEAVEQLAEVFRYTLRRSESEWAPLDQELAFAAAYLDVEQARFGARLRCTIDSDARGPARARALDAAPDADRERGEARHRAGARARHARRHRARWPAGA